MGGERWLGTIVIGGGRVRSEGFFLKGGLVWRGSNLKIRDEFVACRLGMDVFHIHV
jgi:hypothetical protein